MRRLTVILAASLALARLRTFNPPPNPQLRCSSPPYNPIRSAFDARGADEITPIPTLATAPSQLIQGSPDRSITAPCQRHGRASDPSSLREASESFRPGPDASIRTVSISNLRHRPACISIASSVPAMPRFEAFEHAAAIRPDDLQVQLLLGREYFRRQQRIAKSLEHRFAWRHPDG